MAKKSFKLGERCIGGIIQVEITGKTIEIKALDYYTKKIVMHGSIVSNENNARWKADLFLNNLTSDYYSNKIIEWIETKVKFASNLDF